MQRDQKLRPSYDLFDHTADIGIRVRAATLPELLTPAGQALYSVIGDLVATGPSEPQTFDLTGNDPAELLRDYLAELLILFECHTRIVTATDVSRFDISRSDTSRLIATVRTQLVDSQRSSYHHEVKAITYHELSVRTTPGGYLATIIVDI